MITGTMGNPVPEVEPTSRCGRVAKWPHGHTVAEVAKTSLRPKNLRRQYLETKRDRTMVSKRK